MSARRTTRRTFAALGVVAALVLAACGGDDGGGDEPDPGSTPAPATGAETTTDTGTAPAGEGGSFTLYVPEPDTLYPLDVNSGQAQKVLYALFSGLTAYDVDGTALWGADAPRAVAAELTSADQQTWEITLKPGWTFHNGEPVDAASFVRAWNWVAYQPNGSNNASSFSIVQGFDDLQCADEECAAPPAATEMTGLTAVDDLHLTVALNAPTIDFPSMLGSYQFYPLPLAADPAGDREAFSDAPIGNGPFRMDGTWVHNQEINMVRFDEYAGEPAVADALSFRSYTSNETAYNDLLAGQLDILDELPTARVKSAADEFGDRYLQVATGSFRYLGIPLQDTRFADPNLRRALSMAIDRDAIADVIYNGTVLPARNLVAPVVPGSRFADDPCGEWCVYDPAAAKELFDAAGGIEGGLTLWYDAGRGWDAWIEAVANMWRTNLGLEDITFEPLDTAQYFQAIFDESMTGPFRMGKSMNWPTPGNFLAEAFASDGRLNYGAYSNAEVDALLQQAAAAPDQAGAKGFYDQVEDLVLADMPVIPQFWQAAAAVHSDHVSNVVIDVFGRVQVADVVVAA